MMNADRMTNVEVGLSEDEYHVSTTELDFYFYDKLPSKLKQVVQHLIFPISCEQVYFVYCLLGCDRTIESLKDIYFPEKEIVK